MTLRATTLLLVAVPLLSCASGLTLTVPLEPDAYDQALPGQEASPPRPPTPESADDGDWTFAFRGLLGWREHDSSLLDAGDGQVRLTLGFEASPPRSPVGIEARLATSVYERLDGLLSDSATSASFEGQLGLVLTPQLEGPVTPSFGVGGVLGYIEADTLEDDGSFLFASKTATSFSDSYTGLYLRGALDIDLAAAVSFRLEVTRFEGADAILAGRWIDLDGWSYLAGVSVRL